MSAYATARTGRPISSVALTGFACRSPTSPRCSTRLSTTSSVGSLKPLCPAWPATEDRQVPEWLDSRGAAEYLGVHRDTLRKLAAERTIPAHQDGRGCKLFFRRSDLDEWRRAGGRAVQLASIVADAA